jgi:hypothetical protein
MRCAGVGFIHAVRRTDGQTEVSKLLFFFFGNLSHESTKKNGSGVVMLKEYGDGHLIRTHKRDVHNEKTHKVALVADNVI